MSVTAPVRAPVFVEPADYAAGNVPAGWYRDVPDVAYHASPFTGSSNIRMMIRSAAHYDRSRKFPIVPTPDMVFGSAFHCWSLQPHLFADQYAGPSDEKPEVPEGINRRNEIGKEEYATWLSETLEPWQAAEDARVAGRIRLTADELQRLEDMGVALNDEPAANHVLGLGARESSFVWQDSTTGIWCHCRPDAMGLDLNLLADLKTTVDARPDPFAKSVAKWGYYNQGAWYLDGVNAVLGADTVRSFIFVAIEKKAPHGVGVYVLDPRDVARGRRQNELALRYMAECRETDRWPGYGKKITPIGLPRWTRNELDEGDPS